MEQQRLCSSEVTRSAARAPLAAAVRSRAVRFGVAAISHVCLCMIAIHVTPARAAPRLASVFPFSCRAGSQVNVTITGEDLEQARTLVFSTSAVTATWLEERQQFLIRVPPGTAIQECDVWCIVNGQLSNPRRFVVTDEATVAETGGNDSRETAQPVPLPGAVDARLETAAKLDWFEFAGQAGQNLTIRCRSRTLDGSVEPTVTLFEPDGREIAHSVGQRREPILTKTLSSDGTYTIRVADRAYRQNDDSFYRLELLTGTRQLAVFPDLVHRGQPSPVTVYGHELPRSRHCELSLVGGTTTLDALDRDLASGFEIGRTAWQALPAPFPAFNPVSHDQTLTATTLRLADWPVVVEEEVETSSQEAAQSLELPSLICGRFDHRGDVDWYVFQAQKGDALKFDVYGDRLGHEMDVDAAILDDTGRTLLTFPDAGTGKGLPAVLSVESLDVAAEWKAPADGIYRLVVRDLYGSSLFGADRTYALHVRQSRPTFRLWVLPPDDKIPSGYSIPAGGRAALRVFVERQDGFEAPIQIELSDDTTNADRELQLDPCWIGRGETAGLAILSAGPPAGDNASGSIRSVELQGQSVDATPLRRSARVATLLRPGSTAARSMDTLAVATSAPPPMTVQLELKSPDVGPGDALQLTLTVKRLEGTLAEAARIEFPVLPTGMTSPNITLSADNTPADTAPADSTSVPIELKVPGKLAIGRYSLAARVLAKVRLEEKSDGKPVERTVSTWSNAVAFSVEENAQP